jgi:hypothetical protein
MVASASGDPVLPRHLTPKLTIGKRVPQDVESDGLQELGSGEGYRDLDEPRLDRRHCAPRWRGRSRGGCARSAIF